MALRTQTQDTFVADTELDRTSNQPKYLEGDQIFVIATNILYTFKSAGVYITSNEYASVVSPAAFAAQQNDYNPAGASNANVLRLTSTGNQNVTGIVAPVGAKTLRIINIGASSITLVNSSVSSIAANRFLSNGNTVLQAGEACDIWYDTISLRWRVIIN